MTVHHIISYRKHLETEIKSFLTLVKLDCPAVIETGNT